MAPEKIGRYEILGELGKGAMGLVYLARDPLIGRRLALKTFHVGLGVGEDEMQQIRDRFLREAQSAGILNHPNIVTVHDVVTAADGSIVIAMEHVEGTDLKLLLERRGPLEPGFAVDVAAQVADGLDYAHSRGVVHRDVKPANVIVTPAKLAKITDFGIARLDASNLTVEGQLLGTPNYMSPEQIQGREVDHRSDVFSLGVMLYEMLTRQKPFGGDNLTTVTYRIVNEPHPPPTELVPDLRPELAAVVDRALAKDPDARYPSAGEMAAELRAAVAPQRPSGSFLTASLAADATPAPAPASGIHPLLGSSAGAVASGDADPTVVSADAAAASDARPAIEPASAEEPASAPRRAAPWLAVAGAVVAAGVVLALFWPWGEPGPAAGPPQPAAEAVTAATAPRVEPGGGGAENGADDERVATAVATAQTALAERDYPRALASARAALALEPDHVDARRIEAEALRGQERRAEVRDRFRRPEGVAVAAEEPSPPLPPPPVTAAPARLRIELVSHVAEGRLTVYDGQTSIYQESFDFLPERRGLLGRSRAELPGRLSARLEHPSGATRLRVYAWLKETQRTAAAEAAAELPAGGDAVLRLELTEEGRLRARLE